MTQWVRRGLGTGIKTTSYPDAADLSPGATPGLPIGGIPIPGVDVAVLAARCPTQALTAVNSQLAVDPRRCVHAYRCARGTLTPVPFSDDYEWATANASTDLRRQLGQPFTRSVHIRVVDAGDCGACLNEVKQLNNPYYNMHRLGFFITPTPRHADILLVVGPVTDHMRVALMKTYDAMPTPRRVIAVGACAISGGVFGPSFMSEGGLGDVLPVDVEVPGNPPPPLAILHGLLLAVGRAQPAAPRVLAEPTAGRPSR